MKPTVLISVFCGSERHGWINPGLVRFFIAALLQTECLIELILPTDLAPIERARNIAAKRALDIGVEWLLMLDNDIEPPKNILDVLATAGDEHDIIALPYWVCLNGILVPTTGASDTGRPRRVKAGSGFQEVYHAGTGAMFIRRKVLEKMSRPHFAMGLSADGLEILKGEDYDFCERARELGFHIWTHGGFACEHLHQLQLGYVASKMPVPGASPGSGKGQGC